MIEIPLTKGKVALIDDQDAHLATYKWCYGGRYAIRACKKDLGLWSTVPLHSCIMGVSINNLDVDHINGNPLDNRRENLRLISHRLNISNNLKRINCKTKSLFPGLMKVSIENGKYVYWQARIRINGVRKYLGTFKTQQLAFDAYSKALGSI